MSGRILVALALTAAIGTRVTSAECLEPVALVYSAPDECPSAEAFFRSVSERLEKGQIAEGPSGTTFRVTITRDGDVHTGRLSKIPDPAASPPEAPALREVSAEDCAETARAMALVTALAVEARVTELASVPSSERAPDQPASGSQREAEPEREPAPKTVAASAPERTRAEPRPSERDGLDLSLGARAAITTAHGPEVLPGADLFAALSPSGRAWLVQLSLGGQRGARIDAGPGEARFSFVGGRLSGCALGARAGDAFAIFPCVWLETGVVIAEGFIDVPETVVDPWLALGATGLVTYRRRDLVVTLEAGPVFPLTRGDRFVFGAPGQPEAEIHDVPGIGAFAALGAGWVLDGP